ncbi:hypothetical protein HNY73_007251 [Argiope bruennichi]|uniref:MULE transposase domain-containing protein n=1 Tax=Argiope bruennichi TaxID=94029 RepID=A0A8T0FDD3_ARGBR|nr:hypothetical protein HNY73_007251 [Argiope bruennichi]
MRKDNDNPILIYKTTGDILPDFPSVKEKDFLLGMMNDAQEKLLELYGNSCVMIDSTHGTNQYAFELLIVMIHDENHQGLPVATLFSSRMSCEILLPFFAAIKKRLPTLNTKVIMTDDTTSFTNACKEIFHDNPTHLLCSWYINKNWNANINSKVKNYENRTVIKNILKNLMTETDIPTFEKLLKRWHRQLKCEEGDGKVMKRMDKALSLVINAVAKKLLSRVISMERGKLTSKVAQIRKCHTSSNEMGSEYAFYNLENKIVITKPNGGLLISESETIQDQENLDNENNLVIIENDPREKLEVEKSAIISHLQNECSKDFDSRKSKIVNQLKEVLVKAQNWDSAYPLSDVEEKIKVLNACFDLSVASTSTAYLQNALPESSKSPANKNITKQRKFTIKKKSEKLN